jgi:hypothetical protein
MPMATAVHLGQIPVTGVGLDETRRRSIDARNRGVAVGAGAEQDVRDWRDVGSPVTAPPHFARRPCIPCVAGRSRLRQGSRASGFRPGACHGGAWGWRGRPKSARCRSFPLMGDVVASRWQSHRPGRG